MQKIDTETKIFALLGTPLIQSFSPQMHNRRFAEHGINALYIALETDGKRLQSVLQAVRALKICGFNVTKPLKVAVMPLLDKLDPLASRIGEVNTVKNEDGKLIGFNTDGTGFVDSLIEDCDITVVGKRFFIHGCGGAGRAVAFTLADRGAGQIVLASRSASCHNLAADLKKSGYLPIEAVSDTANKLKEAVMAAEIYINATGLGMKPAEPLPIDPSWLSPKQIVCDLTYNPAKTGILLAAERVGCRIINGIGMVVGQGALAHKIWFDLDQPPTNDLRVIVDDILRNSF